MFSPNLITRRRQEKASLLFVCSGLVTALLLTYAAPWPAPTTRSAPTLRWSLDAVKGQLLVHDAATEELVRTIVLPVDLSQERITLAQDARHRGVVDVQLCKKSGYRTLRWITFDTKTGKQVETVGMGQ